MSRKRTIRRSLSNNRTSFQGVKSIGGTIETEAPLESDLCYHLEFDDSVVSYEPQPKSLKYFFEGAVRTYTADFEVKYKNGITCLIEVKYEKDLARIDNYESWKLVIENACSQQGMKFLVLTEKFIRESPAFENLQLIWSARTCNVECEFLLSLINCFKVSSSQKISELIGNDCFDKNYLQILRLILEKKLRFDIGKSFISKLSFVEATEALYDR